MDCSTYGCNDTDNSHFIKTFSWKNFAKSGQPFIKSPETSMYKGFQAMNGGLQPFINHSLSGQNMALSTQKYGTLHRKG